jgi:uncharacterized membrane protein YhhN
MGAGGGANLALALAGTALTVVALGALLWAERTGSRRLRYASKPAASLGFLIVAAAAGAPGGGAVARWIAIGLALGAAGDVALMFEGELAFLAGLGLFLAGHVAYVAAFATIVPLGDWLHAPPLVLAAPALGAAIALAWLWRHLGSMKVPVIAYVAVITAMVIGALVCRGIGGGAPIDRGAVQAAAAILFFASDLSVARDRFVAPGFANRAWGLPAYYAAQLLFAWSLT